MQQNHITLVLFFLILSAACTKGPGEGGRASISGKVYARNYSNSFILRDSGYIGDQKVFIIYGDEQGVSDNVDTDFEGEFVFPYLRPGKYSVYVYTKRFGNTLLDSAIVQTVTIDDRRQQVELPTFDIITLKN
jgi:hypothetical protein